MSICETLARSNALDVIVIDSVAALVPKAELEGEMGMATMGMQARLMSQALRKLTALLAKAKTTCVFTNQMREKVGVMFGNPETTPGGKALEVLRQRSDRHPPQRHAQGRGGQRRRQPREGEDRQEQGGPALCRGRVRHYLQPRHQQAKAASWTSGLENGVVEKKGAWLQFEGQLIGQGKEAAQKALVEKPELANKIVAAIMAKRNAARCRLRRRSSCSAALAWRPVPG